VTAREQYVRELQRRLPFALGHRVRVVAEVREHLREGGEEALARFGSVDELAAELRPELRLRALATASWLVPVLVVVFVVPFYVIPENAFPPAPWDAVPGYLAWKHDAALVAFAVSVGAAAAAALIGRISPRWALAPLWLAVAALVAAAGFAMVMDVQWIDEVPGTSAALVYGGLLPLCAAVVALAVVVVVAALRDGRRELAAD
jgi:uncharacterized membrane protein YjjB (DUF3815 family)